MTYGYQSNTAAQGVAPRQPYAQPRQPYAQPRQPYAQPRQPYAQPRQPYAQPRQPYAQPRQPYTQPRQPYAQPGTGAALPVAIRTGAKGLSSWLVAAAVGFILLVGAVLLITQPWKNLAAKSPEDVLQAYAEALSEGSEAKMKKVMSRAWVDYTKGKESDLREALEDFKELISKKYGKDAKVSIRVLSSQSCSMPYLRSKMQSMYGAAPDQYGITEVQEYEIHFCVNGSSVQYDTIYMVKEKGAWKIIAL